MRKRLWLAVGLFAAMVLAVPVTVLWVHVKHPRNEDAYLDFLQRYGDMHSDNPVLVLPATADLIAEGDAACDWMREQPYALWRTGSEYRVGVLLERYQQDIADRQPRWDAALPDMWRVTEGAWAYLCPAEVELRQGRRPFTPESD